VMRKLISRPCSFSTMRGWAEAILTLLALAAPLFLMRTPR